MLSFSPVSPSPPPYPATISASELSLADGRDRPLRRLDPGMMPLPDTAAGLEWSSLVNAAKAYEGKRLPPPPPPQIPTSFCALEGSVGCLGALKWDPLRFQNWVGCRVHVLPSHLLTVQSSSPRSPVTLSAKPECDCTHCLGLQEGLYETLCIKPVRHRINSQQTVPHIITGKIVVII